MERKRFLSSIMDLGPYGRFEGTFPRKFIRSDERLMMELRPSKALLYRGHPFLALLMFPGTFTIPFMFLVPLLAFLGILGWLLRHWYEVGATLVILVILLVYGTGAISWVRTNYALTDRAVYVRTGVVSASTYRTDFDTIEDICVSRTLFERITGRGTIVFVTGRRGLFGKRKVRWHTISHPEIVSGALKRFIICHQRNLDITEDDMI